MCVVRACIMSTRECVIGQPPRSRASGSTKGLGDEGKPGGSRPLGGGRRERVGFNYTLDLVSMKQCLIENNEYDEDVIVDV